MRDDRRLSLAGRKPRISPVYHPMLAGNPMMTSLNENIFRVTGPLRKGNPPVTGGFPSQRPMTRGFDIFLWCAHKQIAEQRVQTPVIRDAMALIVTSLRSSYVWRGANRGTGSARCWLHWCHRYKCTYSNVGADYHPGYTIMLKLWSISTYQT